MAQADCFITLECECPHCNKFQEVEWVEEGKDDLNEWSCEKCGTEFEYCHPDNSHGLAK